MTTFEKVQKIIAETLSIKDATSIKMESHLVEDLGADSLDAVDIIMGIEDEFGVSVDDDIVQNIKHVSDLVEAIDKATK